MPLLMTNDIGLAIPKGHMVTTQFVGQFVNKIAIPIGMRQEYFVRGSYGHSRKSRGILEDVGNLVQFFFTSTVPFKTNYRKVLKNPRY